jgi:hypothetical protein
MLRSMLGGDGVTHRRTDHQANGAMDCSHQPGAHFLQCAEFLPLRNRGLGPLARPRAFGAPLCGIGACRSAGPSSRAPMRCSYNATRLSDNVRQIECRFSQLGGLALTAIER